jgi:preprotein translocase subunit SecE
MQPSGFIEWKCNALEHKEDIRLMKTDFMTYFRNSKLELSKVIFPTKPQVKQAFFAVFVVVTFVAVFLALVDLLMSSTLSAILS